MERTSQWGDKASRPGAGPPFPTTLDPAIRPLGMSDEALKLLVLDLDETLIFASEAPLPRPADFFTGRYHVYKRPFVDEFLQRVRAWFRLAVWTSSSPSYAKAVVGQLFPEPSDLAFVWASDRCTVVFDPDSLEHYKTKKLEKLRRKGYRLESVIVVDDSPEKHRSAYGNLVRVSPYTGDPVDDELPKLMAYLEQLRHVPNVRGVEKRGWRTRDDRREE